MHLLSKTSSDAFGGSDCPSPGTGRQWSADCAAENSALPAQNVEPMTGIEPAYSAWEADVLPLNYIGMVLTKDSNPAEPVGQVGGRRAVSLRN